MDQKMRSSRLNWTPQEDNIIRTVYERQESKSWVEISKALRRQNIAFQKSAKQCRERYMNFLKHNANGNDKASWTSEEQVALIEKFNVYGSRWVQIAQAFPQKSQNCIKNKFYGSLRKALRKVNRIQKQHRSSPHKDIKYESILKLFKTTNGSNSLKMSSKIYQKLEEFTNLKKDLLNLTLNIEKADPQTFLDIASRLHKFISQSRFMYTNTSKSKQKYQEATVYNQSFKQLDILQGSGDILDATIQAQQAQLQEQLDQEYNEADGQCCQCSKQHKNEINQNCQLSTYEKGIEDKCAYYSQNIKDIFTLQEKWEKIRASVTNQPNNQYIFL